MRTTKRRRTVARSAIEIQISARIARPKNGRPIPAEIIRQAIVRKSRTGKDVPGIELKIVRWKHGATTGPAPSNSSDEWIRFGRFLHAASIIVHTRE